MGEPLNLKQGLERLLQRYIEETKPSKSDKTFSREVRARARLAKDMGLRPQVLVDVLPRHGKGKVYKAQYQVYAWSRKIPFSVNQRLLYGRYRFDQIQTELHLVARWLKELAGVIPDEMIERLRKQCYSAAEEVGALGWHSVCPYCKAVEFECPYCKNVRAVTREVFDAAPEELTKEDSDVIFVDGSMRKYPRAD